MSLVINTYPEYFAYLQYRRRSVAITVKANKLALSYFSSLYGHMDTKDLTPIHMARFFEMLAQRKRLQKNAQ